MNECNNLMTNLVKIKDFAKGLGVSESTVRTWKQRHDIPEKCFLKIGNSIFINTKLFNEWVEK